MPQAAAEKTALGCLSCCLFSFSLDCVAHIVSSSVCDRCRARLSGTDINYNYFSAIQGEPGNGRFLDITGGVWNTVL